MPVGTTRSLALSSLLMALLASATCLADGPGPGQGQGKGPAELPDDRLGVRTAPVLLLSREDVRRDLGMSPAQAAAAELAIADLYSRAAQLRGKSGEEAIAARKAVDEAQRVWVDAYLSPEQRDRLVQIDLQWEGPSALVSRPIARDALGLSTEQQGEIQKAIDRRNAAKAAAGDRGEAESGLARTALTVLTEAQRERWKAMLGKPFTPRLATAAGSEFSEAARR